VQEADSPTVLHSFACTAHSQQPQSCVQGKHHTLQDQGLTGCGDMGVRGTVAVVALCRAQVFFLLHLTEKLQNYLGFIALKCRTRIAERGITAGIWKAEN